MTVILVNSGGSAARNVVRLDDMTLGPKSFPRPVGMFSRDTRGLFAIDGPDGIVGGELLRRYRTTFDYPHGRLILEPYASQTPFDYDMSGP